MNQYPMIKHINEDLKLIVKPIDPSDSNCLLSGFYQLSPRSRYFRFMRPVKRLSDQELNYFTHVDHINHEAMAAGLIKNDQLTGIGIARYVRLVDNPLKAEVAVTVVDQYQHFGVGTLLMECLAERAHINGITHFNGYFLSNNQPAEKWLRKLGARISWEGGPVLKAELDIINILHEAQHYHLFKKLAVG